MVVEAWSDSSLAYVLGLAEAAGYDQSLGRTLADKRGIACDLVARIFPDFIPGANQSHRIEVATLEQADVVYAVGQQLRAAQEAPFCLEVVLAEA